MEPSHLITASRKNVYCTIFIFPFKSFIWSSIVTLISLSLLWSQLTERRSWKKLTLYLQFSFWTWQKLKEWIQAWHYSFLRKLSTLWHQRLPDRIQCCLSSCFRVGWTADCGFACRVHRNLQDSKRTGKFWKVTVCSSFKYSSIESK